MKRRILAFVLSIGLLTAALPGTAFAVFNSPCAATNYTTPPTYATTYTQTNMTAVRGTIWHAQFLHPCTLVAGNPSGASQVWAANLQSSSVTSTEIVQLGMVAQSGDLMPTVWYTERDNSGGAVVPASWYPYGIVLGDLYIMDIDSVKISGQWHWKYEVWHYNADGSTLFSDVYHVDTNISTWSSGQYVWWGYEVHNTGDSLGVNYGEPMMALTDRKFKTGNHSYYSLVVSASCRYQRNPQPYYHCDNAAIVNPGDAINGYTTDH